MWCIDGEDKSEWTCGVVVFIPLSLRFGVKSDSINRNRGFLGRSRENSQQRRCQGQLPSFAAIFSSQILFIFPGSENNKIEFSSIPADFPSEHRRLQGLLPRRFTEIRLGFDGGAQEGVQHFISITRISLENCSLLSKRSLRSFFLFSTFEFESATLEWWNMLWSNAESEENQTLYFNKKKPLQFKTKVL